MASDSSRCARGILASALIPWDRDLSFMEDLFREQVQLILQHTPHLYIMGTAGEGYAVSLDQYRQVSRAFVEEMKRGDAEAMVGLIGTSYAETLARIEWARSLGVRRFQISLPPWGTCRPEETERFFDGVCGAHRDCQFLHYNLQRAGRLVEPEEYAALQERNPNLVATKNSSQSVVFLRKLLEQAPLLRHFITDLGFAFASLVGEPGFLISMASCNFVQARRYFDAALRRESTELLDTHAELVRLNGELHALVAPEGHMDGAYDKMYVKLHLPRFPLRLYPPYAGVSEQTFERFRELLRVQFPRWLPD